MEESSSTKKLNVYTWIIQELAVNKTDQVSVVCKDGLTLSVSWLLLASISPCIKDASLSLAELEDMAIIAPDLDVSELQKLIQLISQDGCSLSEDLISESQVEFLRNFDGILWPDFYSNPVFSPEVFTAIASPQNSYNCNPKDPPLSSVKIKFKDDLNKANLIVIKDEETENYEYAFAQPPMEIELEDDLNKATLINIKDEETEEYGNIFAQPIDYIDSSHYVAQPHLKFKNNLKDYSQEFKDKAIDLVKTGCSQKKVAEMLGTGTRTIERWWAVYKREQNLKLNTFDNSDSLENVKSTPSARQKKSATEKVHVNVNPEDITEYDNADDKMIIGSDKCSVVNSNLTTLDNHIKKHTFIQQTCDICGFVSTSKDPSAMKKHKAFNHDPVLHDCPECEGKFNTLQLKTHMKTHKESICNECGLKFKNLRSHVINMHTPFHLQKYKCDICQRGFNDSSKLKMHMYSVHTKERPFKCRYGCDLAYNDMSNRNCHEKKKHGKLFISPKKVQSGI